MPALHLVNRTSALSDCLAVAGDDDTVLLLEDAVFAGAVALAPGRELLALAPDVQARGLARRLATHVRPVSDAEFVTLVAIHQPIVTWR